MRIHFDEEMKKKVITAVTIIIITILLFFTFYNLDAVQLFFQNILSLISPFVLGFAIAFLLNQPMLFIETKLLKNITWKHVHKRTISAIGALLFGILVVGGFVSLLVPHLFESALSLINSFPAYVTDFQVFLEAFVAENDLNLTEIQKFFGGTDILTTLTNIVTEAFPEILRQSFNIMNTVLNVLLGIMSALYMMLDKERLIRHVRIFVYALFPKEISDYLVHVSRSTADIFNNFIIGKAIDSFIIGILCYIGMVILNLPYALLLSVIVGITNMIPVFGPFIGAIPGIIILLIIHPIYAVYFALFIFLLQQFDGNILGPLILGDKLGLPSLWILFSVCVGGGLFGVVGMFIGVPVFTVIYTLTKEFLASRIQKKNMQDIDFDQPVPLAIEQEHLAE